MSESPAIDLKILAQRIQLSRKLRGLTQIEMARRVGCNYRHYQDIEAGRVNMRIDLLKNIIDVLEVSPCFIFDNKQTHITPPKHDFWCSDLLENMQVPVAFTNADGLITYWNTPYCKLMGYKKSEVEGLRYCWESAADESGQKKLREFISSIKEQRPEPSIIPMIFKTKTGQKFPVVIKWDYVFGPDNEIKGLLAIVDPHDNRRLAVDREV